MTKKQKITEFFNLHYRNEEVLRNKPFSICIGMKHSMILNENAKRSKFQIESSQNTNFENSAQL